MDFDLHGCSFAVYNGKEVEASYFTKREDIQRIIDECFNQEIDCVAHFSKGDYSALKMAKYDLPFEFRVRDTSIACNLLYEERRTFGLKKLVPDILGYELVDFSFASDHGMDSPAFLSYAAEDSLATLELYRVLIKEIVEHELDLSLIHI